MSMKDGGPAFPRPLPDVAVPPDEALRTVAQYRGMSLRDWFAGMALIGLKPNTNNSAQLDEEAVAKKCYRQADAMLAERDKASETG